jgi:hypothetical protein
MFRHVTVCSLPAALREIDSNDCSVGPYLAIAGKPQLLADVAPWRPASRALAETKLAEIDARVAELQRAREIIDWGMRCTCPSIDDCTCGIHTAKPANSSQ